MGARKRGGGRIRCAGRAPSFVDKLPRRVAARTPVFDAAGKRFMCFCANFAQNCPQGDESCTIFEQRAKINAFSKKKTGKQRATRKLFCYTFFLFRGVAQPGSALAWGARGREFESRRPDQKDQTEPVMQITGSVSFCGAVFFWAPFFIPVRFPFVARFPDMTACHGQRFLSAIRRRHRAMWPPGGLGFRRGQAQPCALHACRGVRPGWKRS